MQSLIFGSPYLSGDSTVPGVKIPDDLMERIPGTVQACKDFGLSFDTPVVVMLTWDEISEIAAYGGFPNRYPHWSFGMEYEELSRGYEFGKHRIFEMVINTKPLYIYCLDSNSLIDNVTVVAHAIGHGDFFKNNLFFKPTNRNAMNMMADHGTRIERYMERWGRQVVGDFINKILSIDDLIDPASAWKPRKHKEVAIFDQRKVKHPTRLIVDPNHDYMQDWINDPEWIEEQKKELSEKEMRAIAGVFEGKDKDIFKFIIDNAPMTLWQRDIAYMLYEESQYFFPQRMTKTINEGFASFVDFKLMACGGLAGDEGIVDYALHKGAVLGGKYSMNPYALGFKLLMDIEDRWDKGRHGRDYEECKLLKDLKNWDKKDMKGREKVFEVREMYNDYMLINEFLDQEFCDKWKFYIYRRFPSGEHKIVTRDYKEVRRVLLSQYSNGHLPDIRLVEPNFRGKRIMLLEHQFGGNPLHPKETVDTLRALFALWKSPVAVSTFNDDEEEIVYVAVGPNREHTSVMSRDDFEAKKNW
jgi:stage V sporulation protein R